MYVMYQFMYICTLQALLINPSLKEELLSVHKSADNVRRDFCDGEFFKNHPVFSVHSNALQFILYYDDIEVANALGSRAGNHKLGKKCATKLWQKVSVITIGCFHFTLGNIRPEFRSSLSSIFLLAVAKSSLLREFTADAILEKFVQQINMLSQVQF